MPASSFAPGTVLLLDLLKQRSALLFQAPDEVITCSRLEEVQGCLEQLEAAQADGRHAAGYLAYELGFAFEEKLRQRFHQTKEPLLWFGLYGAPEELGLDEAKAMLESVAGDGEAAIGKPEFDMDRAAYDTAFARVRDHLAKGDIYQVNLTMRARFRHQGAPERIFQTLLRRQPVEFAAFLRLEDRTILSLSPELFLERRGTCLRTKPMKGTAPRGRYASEDATIARTLSSDPKQRSENTMIVDLMRNDLSRIADTGTVKVTRLCEVERYQSLHQMTSTVEAEVPDDVGFARIAEHLFPCGSITGAPKLSAMQIAQDLETGPRGVYTGSIGYLAPGGDFRLNVAIRTLVLRNDGSGEAGSGSGVIFDSGASPEYDECALKLRFMSEDTPGFDLIETLAYHPVDGYLLLERHMQRLQASSAYFGFPFREEDVREELLQHVRIFAGSRRVRLLLSADGGISVTSTDLPPAGQEAVFNLVIAQETTWSTDRFLFHKTTNRAFYDDARQRYQAETGCQEVLFLNENGYLTEGSYTTLFVKRNGSLQTPALRHGLLPGTFRAGLLERGLASEADLTLQDLQEAEEVYVGNSVRGLIRARLLSEQASGSWHMEAGQHNEATRKAG
ncbi:aminodeoxychorismate synthase component I [Roseibium aggregatum]|uniref:aminodeoxychorismate synthase component I n=1 Tax=Roseibium aggregatum TaxID=187304 RepID=UPI00094AF645|nr:aminodeoxychorismate synthase component I [Roseibium aggregatum]UFI04962.1 aminodeoxychorismate synthase component I [Roseibium aggregatum]